MGHNRSGVSVLRGFAGYLALIGMAAMLVIVVFAYGQLTHSQSIMCDFYSYRLDGQTRDTMTPPPGWIETSPGSDCWWIP